MDQTRWQQIQSLFEQALDVPADDRDVFVKTKCGGDKDLYDDVIKMLRADENAHSLFSGGAVEALGFPKPLSMVGRRIGSFELVREVGSGGMGVVYLARRVDGQFEQNVAVKLIKRGMDTEQILRRFQIERQILAGLDHPNIARLLDGGVTDDGLPYFTMEYVEGIPIDQYCDRNRLTVEQRLAMFLSACDAVVFAQQNLVVHRDLKPANIVVTVAGQVKLLDFGIAKVLSDQPLLGLPDPLTRTGFRVMTPGYASPEQVRGDQVTTASDVYSLGVILYELLSGRRPYVTTGVSIQEIEKAIVSTDPRRPSAAAVSASSDAPPVSGDADSQTLSAFRSSSPERLKRRLSGDLDNICLMALRKDPRRRYASVEQLREDIKRHLSGLPVTARPETLSYTISKFMQRHRLAVTLAAVIVLVISGLVTFYTIRLAEERDRARTEARKAAEVASFLTDLFEIADPIATSGETVTARELLERGSERIEVELADQPDVQANLLYVIGKVYYNLGLYGAASVAQQQAYEIQRKLFGESSREAGLTLMELSALADINGHYDSAISIDRRAVNIFVQLYGERDTLTANAINNLAISLRHNGELEESERHYRNALRLRSELHGDMHPDVAHTMIHLGRLVQSQGRLEEAEELFRGGLEMQREYFGTDNNADIAASFGALAGCLSAMGRYVDAVALYRRSRESFTAVVGEDHPYTVGVTASCGRALVELGEFDEAEQLIRGAIDVQSRILPENHPHRSNALYYLGELYLRRGDIGSAEAVFRRVLDQRQRTYPDGNWRIAQVQSSLGECLMDQGRYEEAAEFVQSSYQLLLDQLGDSSLTTQLAQKRLERLRRSQHQ
jgi:eukaryotic-like serine/threonine-protein kinase